MFSIERWKKHRLSSLAWGNTWQWLWSGDLSVRPRVDIGETTPAIWSRKRCNRGNKCVYRIVARTAGTGVGWLPRSRYGKDNGNWPGWGTMTLAQSGSWGFRKPLGLLLAPGLRDLSCETGFGNHWLHYWFRNIPPGPALRGQEADSVIVASRAKVFCLKCTSRMVISLPP